MHDRLTRETPGGRTLVIATGHELSLALLSGASGSGQGVEAALSLPMTRGHAEALVPAIADLLGPFGGADARCDSVVVETGPGSFTGLRVGLAAARALALAWRAALRGVRSTQLVAADARAGGHMGRLLVGLAAPRGQIWVEAFAAGGLESLGAPEALERQDYTHLAAGFALVAGTAAIEHAPFVPLPPRAAALSGLALSGLGEAELLYVRTADRAAV